MLNYYHGSNTWTELKICFSARVRHNYQSSHNNKSVSFTTPWETSATGLRNGKQTENPVRYS